jgi:anti-sigma factor RsiW
MNINLNNYESFFLMYVDNELSAAEKKSVEEFLGNYPYLQEELDQLKETVLPVEQKTFDFKAGLLKPVMSGEAEQENLLLHLDNELTGEQKQQMERLLLKDGELQKEFALLKKTKLDAEDMVVFPDKTILYRHESGRLVVGRFTRLAIAAAIVGAGIFIGMNMLDKNAGSADPIAVTTGSPAPKTVKEPVVTGSTDPVTGSIPGEENNEQLASATQPADQPSPDRKNRIQDKARLNTRVTQGEENALAASKIASKEKPVVKDNPERTIRRSLPASQEIAKVDLPENNEGRNSTSIAGIKNKPVLSDVNIQQVENLFARTAAFEEDENSDDHIFMMDEEKVSRTKAAGFLKKIKRTVERTTKIKPGNSLRIAGFEFAVK